MFLCKVLDKPSVAEGLFGIPKITGVRHLPCQAPTLAETLYLLKSKAVRIIKEKRFSRVCGV